MQIHGLHHITAVTAIVDKNLDFYTRTLGLCLVKKRVNQDDTSAYHLFYADKVGTPGTDMTFFDWAQIDKNVRGTDSIVNTLFRVSGPEVLEYWVRRFDDYHVTHQRIQTFARRSILRFEDPEGRRLTLVDDGNAPFEGQTWDGAGVPAADAIRGFYGVMLSVPSFTPLGLILTRILGFEELDRQPNPDNSSETIIRFGMNGGGPGKEVQVVLQPNQRRAQLGSGGVHHVAFRVKDEAEQQEWNARLIRVDLRTSGQIDRYYFKSSSRPPTAFCLNWRRTARALPPMNRWRPWASG